MVHEVSVDYTPAIIFVIIAVLIFLLAFGDEIRWRLHKLDKWFPSRTFRDWIFIILGGAFGYAGYAVMTNNWIGLIIVAVAFIGLLIWVAFIDKKREQQQNEAIRTAVQEGVKEGIREGIKTGVKEAIEELKRDGIIGKK